MPSRGPSLNDYQPQQQQQQQSIQSPVQSTLSPSLQSPSVLSPVNRLNMSLNIPLMKPQQTQQQPTSPFANQEIKNIRLPPAQTFPNESDLTTSLNEGYASNPRAKAMTMSRAPMPRSTEKSHQYAASPQPQINNTEPQLDQPPSSSSSSAMTNSNGANSPISPTIVSPAQGYQWREVVDVRGRSYYYNSATKETT